MLVGLGEPTWHHEVLIDMVVGDLDVGGGFDEVCGVQGEFVGGEDCSCGVEEGLFIIPADPHVVTNTATGITLLIQGVHSGMEVVGEGDAIEQGAHIFKGWCGGGVDVEEQQPSWGRGAPTLGLVLFHQVHQCGEWCLGGSLCTRGVATRDCRWIRIVVMCNMVQPLHKKVLHPS